MPEISGDIYGIATQTGRLGEADVESDEQVATLGGASQVRGVSRRQFQGRIAGERGGYDACGGA